MLVWICASPFDASKRLGGRYSYEGTCRCIVDDSMNIIVDWVIGCVYNEQYIIAKQNNRDAPQFPEDLSVGYYWILDKRDDCYYGPMSELDFLYIIDSLKIDYNYKTWKKIINYYTK